MRVVNEGVFAADAPLPMAEDLPDSEETTDADRFDEMCQKLDRLALLNERTMARIDELAGGINIVGNMMNTAFDMIQKTFQQFGKMGPAGIMGMLGGKRDGDVTDG